MATYLKDDLVRRNQILKSQLELEEIARRNWKRKWGFLLDYNKIYQEEAAKKGVYDDLRNKNKTLPTSSSFVKTAECTCLKSYPPQADVPRLSAGMIGWRSGYSLEKMGKLYISPLHTLPSETAATHIKLG